MNILLDEIELPEDLFWSDETTPWRVGQSIAASLSGAVIVQEGALQTGRPITLESQQEGSAYVATVPRSTVDALLAKADQAGGAAMVLTIPSFEGAPREFQVRWRRSDGPAVEAAPMTFKAPIAPTDFYTLTLRLMQV